MREIKFRIWRPAKRTMEKVTQIIWGTIITHGEIKHISSEENDVDPSMVILMQYTGIKDKNGKEIFEGDIVNMHFFIEVLGESLGVMEVEKEIIGEIVIGEMGIWIQGNNEDDCGYLLWFNGLHEESFEVLGNIYEHPHLLSPQVKTRLK